MVESENLYYPLCKARILNLVDTGTTFQSTEIRERFLVHF